MVLECGGNGRSFFQPQARGNQWTNGGAGCAEWTGVSLADVLKAAGVKPSAVYTANYGTDVHLSGDAKQQTLSRGVPIAKAMQEQCLLVWAMNGKPLENIHGGPLRLVIPGWPGSVSHKWLSKITLRDKEHDGQGMKGTSYRVAIKPMMPGRQGRRLPTSRSWSRCRCAASSPIPANGKELPAGTKELKLRGAAWAGDLDVRSVHVSTDFGATWKQATLAPAKNRFDWRRWTATVKLPDRRLLRGVGARDRYATARRSRMSPATGTRRATAAIRCTASRCWSARPCSGCDETSGWRRR